MLPADRTTATPMATGGTSGARTASGSWCSSCTPPVDRPGGHREGRQQGAAIDLTRSGYGGWAPEWNHDGTAYRPGSATGNGMRNHASWGSQMDVYAIFLTQEAYDAYQLSKRWNWEPEEEQKEKREEGRGGRRTTERTRRKRAMTRRRR